MSKNNFRLAIIIILSAILIIIIIKSFSPFGLKAVYNFQFPDNNWFKKVTNLVSTTFLGTLPNNSIKYLNATGDVVKFKLKLPPAPQKVSSAKISINFKAKKGFKIGIENSLTQEIKSQSVFEPILEEISWAEISENDLTLYQKENKFNSIEKFLNDQANTGNQEKNIGTFDYQIESKIDNPTPGSFETNALLRGNQTLYVYVASEPLKIEVAKQDLNLYDGDDTLEIIGYKNDRSVLYSKIADDGISKKSMAADKEQSGSIEKNLQPGIYKIILKTTNDCLITKIKINQKLVVFDDLFLADNPIIYPIAKQFKNNVLYTDNNKLNFSLAHKSQKQTIKINEQIFTISEENQIVNLNPSIENHQNNTLNQIQINTNDIRVSGDSVFSFSLEAFFQPFIPTTSITTQTDLNSLNFILARYKKITKNNDWYHQELTLPIDKEAIKDDSIQFVIFPNNIESMADWLQIKNMRVILE